MANQIKPPYLGAIVILHLADHETVQNNYAKEMPAIITRVWSTSPPFTVNLKGIPDGTGTIWRTSVMHQEGISGAILAQVTGWRWPDEELKRGDAPLESDNS